MFPWPGCERARAEMSNVRASESVNVGSVLRPQGPKDHEV